MPFHVCFQLPEQHPSRHGVPDRGEAYHTHICPGQLRSLQQGRQEEFRKKGVSDVVRPELDLVSLLCCSSWHSHDPRVQHEDVETGFFRYELARTGLYGGEGGQVAVDIGYWGGGDEGLEVFDCGEGFGFGAGGEVDSRWVVFG